VGERGGRLGGEVRRLAGERLLRSARELGVRALARAEDLVARREPGHAGADRLDRARERDPRDGLLRPPEPEADDADEVGQAA